MGSSKRQGVVDVDFSLALHNRTGKYFIGRDLLDTPELPIGHVYYWWFKAKNPPKGLMRRLIGRVQHLHIRGKTLGGVLKLLPRRKLTRPILHLDPLTVPTAVLTSSDAVLCHDIGPVTHPDLFDKGVGAIYDKIYDEIARIGPHVIFVSKASQRAFEALYPQAQLASSSVVYPALRSDLEPKVDRMVDVVDRPFLLTVGSIGNRKNQVRSISAFERSGLAHEGFCYVICGAKESGADDVEEIALSTVGVVLLPYVTDAELSWLYGNALGFVLVSLLEGFGMPVAEAIARRQIPLVSQDSVLHEVAGDGALLANPLDVDDIAIKMRALVKLTTDEREKRLTLLRHSLDRFSLIAFRESWTHVFSLIINK